MIAPNRRFREKGNKFNNADTLFSAKTAEHRDMATRATRQVRIGLVGEIWIETSISPRQMSPSVTSNPPILSHRAIWNS